jgi:hypothetical protein
MIAMIPVEWLDLMGSRCAGGLIQKNPWSIGTTFAVNEMWYI